MSKRLTKKQLTQSELLLKNTTKRLNKLKKIPLLERGSQDNEDIVKLGITRDHLKELLKKPKKKKVKKNKNKKKPRS